MMGIIDDGRPFIAIKVDCNLRDKDLEKIAGLHEEIQNHYKTHREINEILFLYQYDANGPLYYGGEGKFVWKQSCGTTMQPLFFTSNFTYPENGSGPTDSQKNNFKLVQTLLTTGESEDTRGLIWHIPK